MSQNDFVIDNNTASAARLDIQSAFQALATNNSGASAPSTPYANQWWYETDTNLLKIRNEANTSWVNVAYINQGTGKLEVLEDTRVVNTSGTQTGLIGDQSTSAWEAGTSTTESLVSPAKVAAVIAALVPATVGVGQTWQSFGTSKSQNITYQNTTGRAIQWLVRGSSSASVQVSSNGSTWVTLGLLGAPSAFEAEYAPIIPDQHYYRLSGGAFAHSNWSELR